MELRREDGGGEKGGVRSKRDHATGKGRPRQERMGTGTSRDYISIFSGEDGVKSFSSGGNYQSGEDVTLWFSLATATE